MGQFKAPFVAIDMGTQLLSTSSTKWNLSRGAILPGWRMGLEALGKSTAQLPGVFSDEPKNLIGRDTEGCLLSGAFYGTAAMIDGLAAKMIKPFDGARVIVTGGNASAVIPFLSVKTEYVPELLLEGLYIIYRKNKG